MRKPKPEIADKPRFIPCGRCLGGLVRVERTPGHFVMTQCACMIAFKSGRPVTPPADIQYWWQSVDA